MRRRVGVVRLMVTAGIALAGIHPSEADDRPLSAAQIALFESNHLKNITEPMVLDYVYSHHDSASGDFDDKVTEDIRTIHEDGSKDIWVNFLTGSRRVPFEPMLAFSSNPLLMYFLEFDVREMHEATGGSPYYLRNRIRQSLVDRAEMHPVDFTLDGKRRGGTEIVVTPFRDDPHFDRFPSFAEKSYHFILSHDVPGGIYQIRTTVPDAVVKPGPFSDSVTYVSEHR